MRFKRTSRLGRPSRSSGGAGSSGGGGGAGLAATIESLAPLGWWKLDDASGALADSGSVGNSGTAVGSPVHADVAGPDGASYMRFASGQYISIPDAASLRIGSGKTMCIAFRPTSHAGLHSLFSKGPSGGPREWWVYDGTGTGGWVATIYTGSGSNLRCGFNATPLGDPTLNEWHFLIAQLNDVTTPSLFLDSETKLAGTTSGPNLPDPAGSTGSIHLGAWPAFETSYYMVGALAHAALFDGVLSDADCQTLMAAAIAEGWAPAV